MRKHASCTAVVLLVLLCAPIGAGDALSRSASLIAEGAFDDALTQLRKEFEAGYPEPADVYSDPRFAALRESAASRGAWRELMGEFVRESNIDMVTPDEPGTPMIVRGRVLRSPDGAPVPGAVIHLYHTDDTGNYEPGRPAGDGSNPRLFAWVRSDDQGHFEVRTIEPGAYPGSRPGAAHVHYRVNAEGYRAARDEFRPYTEPADAGERATALRRGQPTSVVSETKSGLLCEVVIPLRAE